MSKTIKMSDVFQYAKEHGDDYYTKEYQQTWIKDFDLLDRLTKDCTIEEVERLYDMINGETYEIMDMLKYIGHHRK